MCSSARDKITIPHVRQNEPVSLFSENQEAEEDKIDFSKLDITEAVQHGARQRFDQLLEEGVSPNTGMEARPGQDIISSVMFS